MFGEADGLAVCKYRPGNRLPDPPGCIGGKFDVPLEVELVHSLHQTQIPFLNEIQQV
jgi:hypothetical protein